MNAPFTTRPVWQIRASFICPNHTPTGANDITTEPRPLPNIAIEIERDWKNVNYAARPYLDAMQCLLGVNDKYYCDSARDIVRYFLSNARAWRGDTATRIKTELKGMIGA